MFYRAKLVFSYKIDFCEDPGRRAPLSFKSKNFSIELDAASARARGFAWFGARLPLFSRQPAPEVWPGRQHGRADAIIFKPTSAATTATAALEDRWSNPGRGTLLLADPGCAAGRWVARTSEGQVTRQEEGA